MSPHTYAFEKWWNEIGSGLPPLPHEDQEAHAKRVAHVAWLNAVVYACDVAQKIIGATP